MKVIITLLSLLVANAFAMKVTPQGHRYINTIEANILIKKSELLAELIPFRIDSSSNEVVFKIGLEIPGRNYNGEQVVAGSLKVLSNPFTTKGPCTILTDDRTKDSIKFLVKPVKASTNEKEALDLATQCVTEFLTEAEYSFKVRFETYNF